MSDFVVVTGNTPNFTVSGPFASEDDARAWAGRIFYKFEVRPLVAPMAAHGHL